MDVANTWVRLKNLLAHISSVTRILIVKDSRLTRDSYNLELAIFVVVFVVRILHLIVEVAI
jgi:hypothetical protein